MTPQTKKVVSVFLSHRTDDKEAAETLERVLKSRAGGKLEFFVAEAMLAGTMWLEQIKEKLCCADLLFLLYTDPQADWNWCLYETGLFDGIKLTMAETAEATKRIVVFHNPAAEPPPQLECLQSVCANEEGIAKFLGDFFGDTELTGLDEPICIDFANFEEELKETAVRISRFFTKKTGAMDPAGQPKYYGNHMILHIKEPSSLKTHGGEKQKPTIPTNTTIQADGPAFDIFGLESSPPGAPHWRWGDLLERVREFEDGYWIEELAMALSNASQGQHFEAIESTFQNPETGRIYRPVIFRRDSFAGGSMKFHLLFVEQVARGSTKAREPYATLLSALSISARMHWEVCNKFADQVETWPLEQWEHKAISLREALSNVIKESTLRERVEFHGEEEQDRLPYVFSTFEGKAQDAQLIQENLNAQEALKAEIWGHIQSREKAELSRVLKDLRQKNLEVMGFVAQHYDTLVARLCSDAPKRPRGEK